MFVSVILSTITYCPTNYLLQRLKILDLPSVCEVGPAKPLHGGYSKRGISKPFHGQFSGETSLISETVLRKV
jgi:hypothetical protein